MDERKHNDFPTGSSGGGGKRGYGVRASLNFFVNGDDAPQNARAEQNEASRSVLLNRCLHENEEIVVDWINNHGGDEVARINIREENRSFANSPDVHEHQVVVQHNGGGRYRANEGELAGQDRAFGVSMGFSGYFGCANEKNEDPAVVGAPVQGMGEVPISEGKDDDLEHNEMAKDGNDIDHDENQDDLGFVLSSIVKHGFGGLYGARHASYNKMFNPFNEIVYYYVTNAAYAHQRLDGEIFGQFLSLRDPHIFNILNATDFIGVITQIIYDPDLAETLISHIECVKVLLERNVSLALTKQIKCVNAVMRLINEHYHKREAWTYPIMNTVIYDLRVLGEKATASGCCGQAIIRRNWAANSVVSLFHPPDCQCDVFRLYRSSNC